MWQRTKTIITPGWADWLRAAGLTDLASLYRSEAGDVITRTGSTEVRRLRLSLGDETRTVFLKKYWVSRRSQLWSGALRGTFLGRSKARREYENLARLRLWGLAAPAPVAYGEERVAGWLLRSFLISEGVPDPVPLQVYIRDELSAPASLAETRGRRRALLDGLARATRRLHEHRFVHHDYFWRNILLSRGGLEQFFLIDAHKGRTWYPGEARRARACDLAALDAAAPAFFRRTERMRFFLQYRQRPRLDPAAKALLRLILRLAAPMRGRQLRRARGENTPAGSNACFL
jgi:tRNA A-37 threonylcarbamoyl transferase component Bud32